MPTSLIVHICFVFRAQAFDELHGGEESRSTKPVGFGIASWFTLSSRQWNPAILVLAFHSTPEGQSCKPIDHQSLRDEKKHGDFAEASEFTPTLFGAIKPEAEGENYCTIV